MRRGHYDDGDDADVGNRGDGCGAGGTSKRLKRSGGGGATDEPSTSASPCVVFEASTNENENENETIAMIAKTTGDGEELMSALLAPLGLGEFRERFLDARPAVIRGGSGGQQAGKFSGWFDGLRQVEAYVRSGRALEYGRDVDVTSYVDGKRRTHNRNGDDDDDDDSGATTLEKVDPDVLMRRFRKEKCSLRLLHPQTWHDATWEILATLEKFWQCACGCNIYVTPADSQGFAPHYDDIDAFVLQLEGAKRWRVYEPFADDQYPRLSSRNYTQEEVSRQRVLFDGTLEAGDVLYMPRGTIHQAECASGTHSIHATISTNQANAPADALEVLIPNALAAFIQENVDSRRNLRVGWAEAAFEEKEENDEDGVYVRPRTQQVRTCVERSLRVYFVTPPPAPPPLRVIRVLPLSALSTTPSIRWRLDSCSSVCPRPRHTFIAVSLRIPVRRRRLNSDLALVNSWRVKCRAVSSSSTTASISSSITHFKTPATAAITEFSTSSQRRTRPVDSSSRKLSKKLPRECSSTAATKTPRTASHLTRGGASMNSWSVRRRMD